MSTLLQLDFEHCAVLTLDLQVGVVSAYAKDAELIPRASELLHIARRAGVRVIHVKVAFRPGVPEASPRNVFLTAVKGSAPHQRFFQGDSGAIHHDIALEATDLVVTKSRVSAFVGTDLDMLLRANDVHTLILLGIATSGAVLSTALQAADLDYRVIVVKDCCADLNHDVHTLLADKVLPQLCRVVLAAELRSAMAER